MARFRREVPAVEAMPFIPREETRDRRHAALGAAVGGERK
jgi:hypothetical protein